MNTTNKHTTEETEKDVTTFSALWEFMSETAAKKAPAGFCAVVPDPISNPDIKSRAIAQIHQKFQARSHGNYAEEYELYQRATPLKACFAMVRRDVRLPEMSMMELIV